MEVYDKPVNRFVASFLGTPPMNFFDGIVDIKAGTTNFIIENDTIALPDNLKEIVAAYNGNEMVFGIRPENISSIPYQGQTQNTITTEVQIVEPLGDRMDVYLKTSKGNRFIANMDPHIKIKVGDTIQMHVDMGKVHIFETGLTGRNITFH